MKEKLMLQMDSIVKTFPGVKVLDGAHLDVRRGGVHALCGKNGTGESTLVRIITGAQGYISRCMYVNREEVVFHSIKGAEYKGIAIIYQEFNMVRDLPVVGSMYLGRFPKTPYGAVDWKKLYKDAQEELDHLGLKFDCRTRVWNLFVAESQTTEITKCLIIGAKVIIMDEPAAALTDEEIHILFRVITELGAEGISIPYVPHRTDEILQISGRLTVFRDEKHIVTKDIGNTNYDEVVSMMVGHSVANLHPEGNYTQGEAILELRDICGKGVHDVNIRLHKGEILGVVRPLRSGTTELSKVVYRVLPVDSGEIYIDGEKKDCSNPKKALKAGIELVSDDRRQEELVFICNIRENVSLSSLDKITYFIHLDKKLETKQISVQVERLNVKVNSLQQLAGKPSGGDQQKVVFAKVLEASPSILILGKPARDADMGARAEIHQIMDELTRAGKSIILISADPPEIIGMSGRVVITRKGHTVLEIPKSEMNQEIILAHASGGAGEDE